MGNIRRVTGSSAALHCRLYSAAPPALYSRMHDLRSAPEAAGVNGVSLIASARAFSVWLRLRAPEARRSRARSEAERNSGKSLQRISEPLARGGGEGGARDNAHRTADHGPAGSP